MKVWKVIVFIAFATGALVAQQGNVGWQYVSAATGVGLYQNAQGQLIRIVTPMASQKLATSYVNVNYELLNSGAAGGEPIFRIQLDARPTVDTDEMQYTFIGLTPGRHTLMVQIVDGNGTPVLGGRATVVFFVLPGANQ